MNYINSLKTTNMKKILTLLIAIPVLAFSQQAMNGKSGATQLYKTYFDNAYNLYPNIPRGVLEAVAYGNTHIYHIVHNPGEFESCTGLPKVYGVMGLTLDGQNYFNNNLVYVSNLSGVTTDAIIMSPEKNILAYAKAFNTVMNTVASQIVSDGKNNDVLFNTFIALSELPHQTEGQIYALNAQLYSYYSFLGNMQFQAEYGFSDHNFDLQSLFGEENYRVLSSTEVTVSEDKITDPQGNTYKALGSNNNPTVQSTDYSAAVWTAAASCNYSSRSSSVTAVVIHDVEGSYSSCISWFQNCNAHVSAHYVVRSSDGQVTQMVLESKKAWHVGSENGYTIGIEHEGFQAQTGWYTTAMYTGSSNLVKDICASGYGINPTTCWNGVSCNGSCVISSSYRIKGHQHYPNQTHDDPGPHWNWYTYYSMLNNTSTSCGTPSGLTASSITSNSVSLNWNSVSGASSYNVQYKPVSSSTWTTTSSSSTSKPVGGLSASTSYEFKVQAVCSSTGSYSSSSTFATTSSGTGTGTSATVTLGTATTPYSAHPFGSVYMDERVEYIITKAELASAGWSPSTSYLKSLAFNVASSASQPLGSFTITMAHTSSSAFVSTTFQTGSNATTVYSGTYATHTGWNQFNFTTAFAYNGSSNLLITICWNNSSFTANSSVLAYSYSDYKALYCRSDVTNGGVCAQATGTLSYYRPNAKLGFSSTPSLIQFNNGGQRSLTDASANESAFDIFPNPSDGKIIVGKFNDTDDRTMTLGIYDMLGREVFLREIAVEGGSFSLTFGEEHLKAGMYSVVGVSNENRFTKRMIVK